MPRTRLSLSGKRFGRLSVIAAAGSDGHHSLWKTRCDCGRESVKLGTELRSQRFCSPLCPHHISEVRVARATHAMSRHPAYAVWRSMLARCNRPSHRAFKNYGGRGIHVCEAWSRFESFWEDMGPSYVPGLTLDRIDNDAGYWKENCRWASRTVQARNKLGNVFILTPLGTMTIAEASDRFGIASVTLSHRIKRGWPAEKLLIEPDCTNRITR